MLAGGRGLEQTLDALRRHDSGLAPCRFETVDLETFVGEVAGVDDVAMRGDVSGFDCRNNRLAQLRLMQDGFVEAVSDVAARIVIDYLDAMRLGLDRYLYQ
jgi:3-oxoacyl-[acyl-carrier-protein] synthase I